MISLETDKPLPVLRSDIEIYSGPMEEDGSPMYIVHDPVSGTFSKIGWEEAQVLKRLRSGQTLLSLMKELRQSTTLNITSDDVMTLCADARLHRLTMDTLIQPPQHLMEITESRKEGIISWLAMHYLYFRIPLIRPDDFLTRNIHRARFLASPPARFIYYFFAFIGLYFLSQRFESYIATFSYFFSVEGFITYSSAIVVLKIAHEFGHAFVAKHYGLRVPTMGLAFMVFFPVAYSDVTDAWRLKSRRKRLNIALAGIRVELVIGAFAIAFWGVTPPGIINSLCFVLSSTTLVSTILVNLNPAMRYDGYYILSDILGIDNLSQQTMDYTKWLIWRTLLDFQSPSPCPKVSLKKKIQMVVYALYAWHYRLFLYLGIAVVIYHKFTKVLGVFLFVLEIVLMLIRPIFKELKMLLKEKKRISLNRRLVLTVTVLVLALVWLVLPLHRIARAPAVFLPVLSQTLYTQKGGEVTEVLKKKGDSVINGDLLVRIESEKLNNDIAYLIVTLKQLDNTIELLSKSADRLGMVPEFKKQLASREEELAGLMEQRKQLVITAKMDGIIADLNDTLKPGVYVKENQVLGHITSFAETRIDAFFSEKEVKNVKEGDEVIFYPEDFSKKLYGTIARINPIREDYVDVLDIGSIAAHDLPLVKDPLSDRLTFVESYYKVAIDLTVIPDKNLRLGTSGYVRYHTGKRSLAWEFLQYCYSIIIRESGF